MKISLGMLAYNESQRIASTIRCVFAQTLFQNPPAGVEAVELVIVPNGCTDCTAEAAQNALDELLPGLAHGRVSARVEVLAQPGKSNAWNHYVHSFARQDADVVFLLDSDVLFTPDRCLEMLVEKLGVSPQAYAVVGRPLKDIALKERKSLFDRISLVGSAANEQQHAAIAGSLYAVRGEIIRRIWMPRGLLVEDGFVRSMLITNFFTNENYSAQYDRVVRAEGAHQVFEAVRSPRGIFKHSKRLLVGVRINACIYDKLWHLPRGEDAGAWCHARNEENPDWLRDLVHEKVRSLGFWVMPDGLVFRRFRELRDKPLARAVRSLFLAMFAFPFETAVLWAANRAVRRGEFRW